MPFDLRARAGMLVLASCLVACSGGTTPMFPDLTATDDGGTGDMRGGGGGGNDDGGATGAPGSPVVVINAPKNGDKIVGTRVKISADVTPGSVMLSSVAQSGAAGSAASAGTTHQLL